jgi:hypothetical protein
LNGVNQGKLRLAGIEKADEVAGSKRWSSQGSALRINEGQQSHNAGALHGVGEVALLLGCEASETTGKDLAAFSDELFEQIHILVINGIARLDRGKTLLEERAGHNSERLGSGVDLQGHLISLWGVDLLQWGQNFLISSRSVVFRRFFSVV